MVDMWLDRKSCIEKNIGEISQKKIKLSKRWFVDSIVRKYSLH